MIAKKVRKIFFTLTMSPSFEESFEVMLMTGGLIPKFFYLVRLMMTKSYCHYLSATK